MSDSTLDDEDRGDSRETCWYWESRAGKCHLKSLTRQFESLFRGGGPCADCPVAEPWHCLVCSIQRRFLPCAERPPSEAAT